MGIWTPNEDEPMTCHWCGGLITSKDDGLIADYINGESDEVYCSKQCQIEAAKAERTEEWVSL